MPTQRNDHSDLSSLMHYPQDGQSDPAKRVAMRREVAVEALNLDDLGQLLDMLGLRSRQQHLADLAHIGEAA